MGLSTLLSLSALISPFALVSASPVPAQPLERRQDASHYVSSTPPKAGMMLDPPPIQNQSKPSNPLFKSFLQTSSGDSVSHGKTIEEILDKPMDGSRRIYELDIPRPKGIKQGAMINVTLQRKECEQEKVEFYIGEGQKTAGNSTWGQLVTDLSNQKPEEMATHLKAGVTAAQSTLTQRLTTFFTKPPQAANITAAGLAPGAFPFPPTTMQIYGWSSVSGFQYSLQANPPPEIPNPAPNNRTITTAALAFVSSGLNSLASQLADQADPLPLRQTAVAWATVNALLSILDYSVKNLQDDGVTADNKAEIPSAADAETGFKAFSSGRYGSIKGDFATVKSLQAIIDKGDAYPECFPVVGSGL